jgi:glycosyltransferase involved in cell wall biosynthesis
MRILFDHPTPFSLAHGGFQIQIEQTKVALESLGVEVDWLRWWDEKQHADVIHFFGRPSPWYVRSVQSRGGKLVLGELLTGLGSRGGLARAAQARVIRLLRRNSFFERMGWDTFRLADACVALTAWEAQLMSSIFEASPERVHVVPNGVEEEFFVSPPVERGQWLVCTATITERKRVLELARSAVGARTPIWIIGRPYSEADSYGRAFAEFQQRNRELIRYEGAIRDRSILARIYREARGFVLLSTMESLSLSALEAAACECPLLLSDLPWARSTFGEKASYTSPTGEVEALRRFYDAAPTLPRPQLPLRWSEVGRVLVSLYERLALQ